MTIDVIVPVRRIHNVERLLWSLSRNSRRPDCVTLVTNDPAISTAPGFGLNVRAVRFSSARYAIGSLDAALRRNVGIWTSQASHVVTFDDDQLAPVSLVEAIAGILQNKPFCWGHHRFLDFTARTYSETLTLPPEAGRPREFPPNAWHSWLSCYAGLFAAEREFLIRAGGFDMLFGGRHGGEDQNLGRRLAALDGRSTSIYVHEPPYAWHPLTNTNWDEPCDSNLCAGEHSLQTGEMDGVQVQRCSLCPYYWAPESEVLRPDAHIRFDAAQVKIHEEKLSSAMPISLYERLSTGVEPSGVDRAKALLLPAYEDYVSRVSAPDHAISLEAAAYLHALCEFLEPNSILDLGSGFSSFAFRTYAAHRPAVSVHTIDDDEVWLERTRNFVSSAGLSTENFGLWPEYQRHPSPPADIVFHDLGSMSTRLRTLPFVLNQNRAGGIVVLDDMHKEEYAPDALRVLMAGRFEWFNARPYTLDRYGRHAWVASRSATD